MDEALYELYDLATYRKNHPLEDSYTSYLFEQGLDKILQKLGEEASEVIIAAKNISNLDLKNEVCDLLFGLVVLLVEKNIKLDEVNESLKDRISTIGEEKRYVGMKVD